MGEMAELLADREEREYWDLVNKYGPGLWTTKDGDTLEIKYMKANHIRNCIRYLEEDKTFLNIILDGSLLREDKLEEFREMLERKNKACRIPLMNLPM